VGGTTTSNSGPAGTSDAGGGAAPARDDEEEAPQRDAAGEATTVAPIVALLGSALGLALVCCCRCCVHWRRRRGGTTRRADPRPGSTKKGARHGARTGGAGAATRLRSDADEEEGDEAMATGAMDSGNHGEAEGVSREKRSARRAGGGRPMGTRLGGKKGRVLASQEEKEGMIEL